MLVKERTSIYININSLNYKLDKEHEGISELANAGYGSLGAFVSELGAMELPFIFGRELDIDRIRKVTGSELYEEWQIMLAEKIGARVVAPAWYYGHRDILVKKPAASPGDLKGVKVRVVPAPLYVEIMKGLGAVPTPVDWPEVYNALKQGVIDGVDAATDSIEYMKFYEGATHYLGTHVSGCVKARINGEQRIPHPAICGTGDDSERWVGI